jgi:SHAQKYF class myb-like DNA-binding protein
MEHKAISNLNKSYEKNVYSQQLVISSIDHTIKGISTLERIKSNQNLIFDGEKSRTLTEENNSIQIEKEYEAGLNHYMPMDYPFIDLKKNYQDLTKQSNYPYESIPVIEHFFPNEIKSKQENQEFKFNTGRWSSEEHQKFIEAMFLYGNEWKRVQVHIKTRSSTQARSHAQKFFIRLRKKFLDDGDDISSSENKIAIRNEKIFCWIKENVNPESIFKLAKSSGNLLNPGISSSLSAKLNSNYEVNSSVVTANNMVLNESCEISSLQKNYQIGLFFNERKDKLCKIILSLISNTSKSKRKNFGKDDFTDENEDLSKLSLKTLNNDLKENSLKQSGLTGKNNYNNFIHLGDLNGRNNISNFSKLDIFDNIVLNSQTSKLCNSQKQNKINNFSKENNISSLRENLIPCINYPLYENKEENCHSKKLLNTEEKIIHSNNSEKLEGSKGLVQLLTPIPPNCNYYNPNTNNYISIVTINLGCKGKKSDLNSTTSPIKETNLLKSLNSNSNKKCSSLNNLKKTPQNCLNSALYQQTLNNLPLDTQILINKKIDENSNLREFLNRKRNLNSNIKISTQGNIISQTNNLNIVNGNLKSGIVESEKEKDVSLDPFKLTFEECSNNFFEYKDDSDICNEKDENFDLNLGDYFKTDY